MKKEEILQSVGKPFLRPLRVLQLLLLILFFSSPFVFIWHSWSLAWKIGLTGLIGFLIVYFFYFTIKQALTEIIDEEIEKQTKSNKSKFQQKLDEIMVKSSNDKVAQK